MISPTPAGERLATHPFIPNPELRRIPGLDHHQGSAIPPLTLEGLFL